MLVLVVTTGTLGEMKKQLQLVMVCEQFNFRLGRGESSKTRTVYVASNNTF